MDISHDSFLSALWLPRFSIGRRLRPYSIGHQFALKAADNAFVQDLEAKALSLRRFDEPFALSEIPTFPDLIEAAFICSHTFEAGQIWRNSRWLPLKAKWWGFRAGKFDVVSEIRALQRLIIESNQEPEDLNRHHNGREIIPSSPWENRLRLKLLTEGIAKSSAEAWNYPLRLALVDLATLAECRGEASFMSDREREMIRLAKEMEEKEVSE